VHTSGEDETDGTKENSNDESQNAFYSFPRIPHDNFITRFQCQNREKIFSNWQLGTWVYMKLLKIIRLRVATVAKAENQIAKNKTLPITTFTDSL
jgi:hypothetical protein